MILTLLNRLYPGWQSEHRFHPTRRWRFDFANENLKIAVEIEGGVWVQGRHTRGKGFLGDMEKYNQAQILGWKVLRYEPRQTAEMRQDIKLILKKRDLSNV